jgi:hypothetical protein
MSAGAGSGGRNVGVLGYLEVLFATMAVATTALLYGGFFTSRAYLPALLAAAGGAAVLAILAATRGWRGGATTLVAVLGAAVVAVAMVYRGTLDHGLPGIRTVAALGTGPLRGWARMLSVALPADVTPDLLITPVLVTWAAAFVATTLILRTRAALAPVVPPVLALVAGLLFTAARPAAGLPIAGVLLLETLLLTLFRMTRLDTVPAVEPVADAPPPPGQPGLRRRLLGRVAFGIPVALLVSVAGVAGAWGIPVAHGTHRFDPRMLTPRYYQIEDTLTPLVGIKSQLLERPARTLFTLRVVGAAGAPLDRVRIAALDSFDGALWTSRDSFLVAGHRLPRDPNLDHVRQVTVHVDLQDLAGPYLPVVGWPVRVNASGLGFSPRSGVLVARASTGLREAGYDLVADVASRDDGLRTALPNLSGGGDQDTHLPAGLPPELADKAAELAARAATPYAKLQAIQDYLRGVPYSLDARPGHSYDALLRLFSANPQDRAGYAEQLAAAFAVLARAQGFPTRVAVGYLLHPAAGRPDVYPVTTADAHAWPEVRLAGYGWVPFDPTDFTSRQAIAPPPPQTAPGNVDKPGNNPNPGSQPVVDPHLRGGPGTGERILTGTVLGAIALTALVLLSMVAVLLEKQRRRLRRRRGTPSERIVGAWREATDRLVERGVPVPRSLTAAELAVHAGEQVGEPARSVAVLAPILTAALFDPAEPDDETVREAWQLSTGFQRDLYRSMGFARALVARLDPRPLVYGWRDRRRLRDALHRIQGG